MLKVINRRTEPRFKTDGTVGMRIVYPAPGEIMEARVCDISRSGLRFEINQQVITGAAVIIRLKQILVSAEVRRCSEIDFDLYDVGLKILEVREVSQADCLNSAIGDFQAG